MSDITIKEHEVVPFFDMEGFMTLCQESRLGGAVLERLVRLWGEWLPELKVVEIGAGKISYLAVWLPESVEQAVDARWEQAPSDGWQDNNLAQFMCMCAVKEMLPEVEDAGCAPAPRPTETLKQALAGLGLEYKANQSTLNRRFALVTHYPFKGGCEICHLQEHCPKAQGQGPSTSVLLPGYEEGQD